MTIKQKMVASKLVGNGGNITKTMKEVGYSPNTANTPSKLTKSKAWPELMEQYIPDEKLLIAHEEALQATKWNDFTGEREEDHTTRLRAVDLGYKVKGKIVDNPSVLQQFNTGEGGVTYIIQTTNDNKEFDGLTSEPVKDLPVQETK